MSDRNRAAVLGAWALTVAAAFAVGRSIAPAPAERGPAPENLAAAIEAALGEPDVLERAERTAHLLHDLSPENVTEVVEVYDRLLNILGELSIRPFVAAWARFDPEAALDHTLRWPFKDKRELGAGAAIEAWALRDPAGALEVYERVKKRNKSLDSVLFFDLLTGWVYSGQPGLDDYVSKVPDGMLDVSVSRVAAKILRNRGVDGLMHWASSIFDNDAYERKFKRKVFQRTTRMVARWEPERAAAWALERRGQGYAEDGPRIVAEQWGPKDGRAALEWVRNHPDEEMRHTAAREGFRTWFESDPVGAVEWLESERLTAFHDPLILYYAKELAYRAPAEAVSWCERAIDEQKRIGCLKKSASQWYQRDAVAAEAWLQQSSLGEEAQRAVRTPPKEKRLRPGKPGRKPQGARVEEP